MGDPLLFTPRILWFALLVSQLVYVFILTVSGAVPLPAEPPDPMLPLMFGAAAFGVAVASFVVPAVLTRNLAGTVAEGDAHGDPRRKAMSMMFTPFIISLALSEAVSIFGLIVGYLGHPIAAWAPFIASGMLLTAWRFPTEARMMAPLTRRNGVTVG